MKHIVLFCSIWSCWRWPRARFPCPRVKRPPPRPVPTRPAGTTSPVIPTEPAPSPWSPRRRPRHGGGALSGAHGDSIIRKSLPPSQRPASRRPASQQSPKRRQQPPQPRAHLCAHRDPGRAFIHNPMEVPNYAEWAKPGRKPCRTMITSACSSREASCTSRASSLISAPVVQLPYLEGCIYRDDLQQRSLLRR